MSDEIIRAFIALEISDEVRQALAQFQEQLRESGARVGWVKPEKIHQTLVFLGDISADRVPEIGLALDRVAADVPPFPVSVEAAGFFGSPQSPRVLWVGMNDPAGRLPELQERAAAGMKALGFQLEDRPFQPHLTLGRVRSREGVDALTTILGSANNTNFGSVRIERLLLMQSHLEHQGVRYSTLHTSTLKGAN